MIILDHKKADWKAVKAKWDANPMFFDLQIMHGENRLTFQPYLDSSKRYKLSMFINGWYKGEWGLNKEHEYYKYHNVKKLPLKKWQRDANALVAKHNKRVSKLARLDIAPHEPYPYVTPGFDNIAQIKRMVESLD